MRKKYDLVGFLRIRKVPNPDKIKAVKKRGVNGKCLEAGTAETNNKPVTLF